MMDSRTRMPSRRVTLIPLVPRVLSLAVRVQCIACLYLIPLCIAESVRLAFLSINMCADRIACVLVLCYLNTTGVACVVVASRRHFRDHCTHPFSTLGAGAIDVIICLAAPSKPVDPGYICSRDC